MCEAEKSVCDVGGDFSEAAAFNKHTHTSNALLGARRKTHSRRKAATNKIKSLDAHLSFKFTFALRVRFLRWGKNVYIINPMAGTRDRCELGKFLDLRRFRESARFSMTLLGEVADARTFFQSIYTQSKSSVELALVEFILHVLRAQCIHKIAPLFPVPCIFQTSSAFPITSLWV